MENKKNITKRVYINEIIRITYKCNWSCKFCNVLKTNNFGKADISHKEVVYKILNLATKYSPEQRKYLILSFSGGEPTLDDNLLSFIRLAKSIGIGIVEIQTNGTVLFKDKGYIDQLISAGLNRIFLAQHSGSEFINKQIGSFYEIDDFVSWTKFILKNKIQKKIGIYLNIVVSKINLFGVYDYLNFLLNIGFIKIIPLKTHNSSHRTHKISFGFIQPNGYALINKEEVLLKFSEKEIREIDRIIDLCERHGIFPDFHFTAPPLCILHYPDFNLEFFRLRNLERNKKSGNINKSNLESYRLLWKEKEKLKECKKCQYDEYCLGFYKNWIEFVGTEYIQKKINNFFKLRLNE